MPAIASAPCSGLCSRPAAARRGGSATTATGPTGPAVGSGLGPRVAPFMLENGKCLDVDAGQAGRNGATVQIWDCHGGPNQQWTWDRDRAAIVSSAGKCLAVRPSEVGTRGTRVTVWDCTGNDNQFWQRNEGLLVNSAGLCLSVPPGQMELNGGTVTLWDCKAGPNQHWSRRPHGQPSPPPPPPPMPPTPRGRVSIVSSNGKCVDVNGGDFQNRINGGRVIAFDCHGGPNQGWRIEGAAVVSENGKCLDVHGPDFNANTRGARVQVWDCHGGPNQQWTWNGASLIAANGKCLDVEGGAMGRAATARAPAVGLPWGANQQFSLQRRGGPDRPPAPPVMVQPPPPPPDVAYPQPPVGYPRRPSPIRSRLWLCRCRPTASISSWGRSGVCRSATRRSRASRTT